MSEHAKEAQPVDPFKPYRDQYESNHAMPAKGRDRDDILKELSAMAEAENAGWQSGQVSGTFYHAGEEHRAFLNRVFSLFSHANTIQFDMCPSMFKMESEIISMTARMLNGDAVKEHDAGDQVCGTVTSGGTGSILMAMKVYRDWARKEKGIQAPEIIMPHTAHPAFDKSGSYFGIKMVHIPVAEPDFRVDPAAVEAQINENTVAIVGSAGNYPYGLIDPLPALSEIAVKHEIGFHVDGCLGGFIFPWIEKLGYDIPPVRFPATGGDVHVRRHSQVWFCPERHFCCPVSQQQPAALSVFQHTRLARRHVCLTDCRRQPLRRLDRGNLGCHGLPRRRRLYEGCQ